MPSLSTGGRRRLIVGTIIFFVVLCGAIAFAQWWAITKNVPRCQSAIASGRHC
jgi:multidrug resistance efflux pump